MSQFKFLLNQKVAITVSGEAGQIIGRAEYAHDEPNYYLRYCDPDGKAQQAWWPESALDALVVDAPRHP